MKKAPLTANADLVLRIIAVSQAWGFDGTSKKAINEAYEILYPLIEPKG